MDVAAQSRAWHKAVHLPRRTPHIATRTDTGPIVAQAAVPVLPTDDEAALSARIQVEEHRLFPLVVRAVAEGRVKLDGRRVVTSEVFS